MTIALPNSDSDPMQREQLETVSQTHEEDGYTLIQWGILILEVLLVCFTIPHNAKAFGIDLSTAGLSDPATYWGVLGVMTLEGAFILAAIHISHGWLVSEEQTKRVNQALMTSGILMAINAIGAHWLAHPGDTSIPDIVWDLFNILIPLEPIIVFVIGIRMVALHPAIVRKTQALNHENVMMESQRAIDVSLAETTAKLRKEEVETQRRIAKAQIEKERAKARAEVTKLKAEIREELAKVEYQAEMKKQVMEAKKLKIIERLQSAEFNAEIEKQSMSDIKKYVSKSSKEGSQGK